MGKLETTRLDVSPGSDPLVTANLFAAAGGSESDFFVSLSIAELAAAGGWSVDGCGDFGRSFAGRGDRGFPARD